MILDSLAEKKAVRESLGAPEDLLNKLREAHTRWNRVYTTIAQHLRKIGQIFVEKLSIFRNCKHGVLFFC